jgi:hypothetical protein
MLLSILKKKDYLTTVLFGKRCAGSDVSVASESESLSLLLLLTEVSLLLLSEPRVNSQQLYVFVMYNKASPPPPFQHFREVYLSQFRDRLSWRTDSAHYDEGSREFGAIGSNGIHFIK